MQDLPHYANHRFEVVKVAKQQKDASKISSTRIRQAVTAGDVDLAKALLGYPYRISGVVVHGEARGRKIGFPTLNLHVNPALRIPGIGVYAVKVKLMGQWYAAMASVGRNVTFGADRAVTLEIYLLDFSQMVYGEHVEVAWFSRLRGEIRFANAAGLVNQLKQDKQHTRDYFATHSGQVAL